VFNHNYPKVEYSGLDFLKDTSIISNLIFAIQQVTIMQEFFTAMRFQEIQVFGKYLLVLDSSSFFPIAKVSTNFL
jgi:hypothetical protein